jgi:hypothetical protein
VLLKIPTGELPHLKSHRLESGALIFIYADQHGQWLIKAIDNHRLGTRARLNVTDSRNLPKPIKLALWTSDKVAQTQEEPLKWIKNLIPGLNTEKRKVLGKQSEQKGQRLILHINRDSLAARKSTGYKNFTGLS